MAQIGSLYTFSPNTVIRSAYFNSNFNDIKTVYNAHDTATTGVHGLGTGTVSNTLQIPPIGSIIPFYDFNGALTFDALYWAYCNGQSIAVGSLGTQTLPDLSNRYLVGFGTEAGGDIGTASWSVTVVGAASHSVTLTGPQSGIATHTHTASSSSTSSSGAADRDHTHGFGWSSTGSAGSAVRDTIAATAQGYATTTGQSQTHYHSISTSTTTTITSVADTDAVSAHSIQPRSVRVRYIMRIL